MVAYPIRDGVREDNMADNVEIKRCNGGMVSFGTTGQLNTIYMTKHQMCVSPYQDEKYGKGVRVHNLQLGKNVGHSRCTVCGSGYGPVRC